MMKSLTNDIPTNWVSTRLGDLYNFEYGKSLIKGSRTETGRYPVYGSSGIVGMHDQFLIEGPAIIVGRKGAAGSVNYSTDNLWPIDTTYYVRNCKNLCLKFSYYLFRSLNLAKLEASTAIPGLNRNHAYDETVLLPSLAEQHRIVAKIEELFSELDKGIENLQTARAQLKVYRQALLKHAFEGKLTAQWRAENRDKLETAADLQKRIQQERAQRYQQQLTVWEAAGKQGSKPKVQKALAPLAAGVLSELPELPEGWVYVHAEAIADFITKGTTPSKESLFAGTGDIPFIKVYNLTKTGFLDFSINPTFVSKETHIGFLSRSKVYPGDVLMNIVGPPLGKISIVPSTYPEWNINQAIAIFRSKLISNKFLAAYLAHETTVRSMMRKSKATAGQFNLTLEICREVVIPFCGSEEQLQIGVLIDTKLSEADQLDQTIATSLQQAEALRQSILKKAFSGRLVPQDPQDEPASALLARIKAEKLLHTQESKKSLARGKRNE